MRRASQPAAGAVRRSSDVRRVAVGIGFLHPLEPGVHLAEAEPQFPTDPEATRPPPLVAQIVKSLHADAEVGGQLRRREDGAEPVPCGGFDTGLVACNGVHDE
ncbi:hypothetical protein BN11_520036 [Nostocoides australiense Ben110]|uniref:Uncharacterized protein n=1 Tax=Nostocoides australiense Ben110 TaxID=1193182 RepID=W6K235_9MICO|nr:hypothetical protein BN11_520036 [Tetrasphaera australiensis Ben110]